LDKTKYVINSAFVEEKTTNVYYVLDGVKKTENLNIKKLITPTNDNYYKPIQIDEEEENISLNDEKIESDLLEINNNVNDDENKKNNRKQLYKKHSLIELITNNYLNLKNEESKTIINEEKFTIKRKYFFL